MPAKKPKQDKDVTPTVSDLEKQNHELQVRICNLEIAALKAEKKEIEAEIKFLRIKHEHDTLLHKTTEEQKGWAALIERARKHQEREAKPETHNK